MKSKTKLQSFVTEITKTEAASRHGMDSIFNETRLALVTTHNIWRKEVHVGIISRSPTIYHTKTTLAK